MTVSKGIMLDTQPRWSVVATVDEPPQLVQAFVAWHLALGADQIHLYFDRPDDPAMDLLVHLPQVIVTACDPAHWSHVGTGRPHRHQVRQMRNARHAYAQTRSEWLFHCDADEYIWSHRPVAGVLADFDSAVDAVVARVAERVFLEGQPALTIFDGVFRRPYLRYGRAGLKVFGSDFDLTNRGLTGHAMGKAFVRTGRRLNMSIHRPSRRRKGGKLNLARADVDAIELLHFDGLTAQHWIYKLLRMADALLNHDGMTPSKHRRHLADALLVDPGNALGLQRRLKCADAELLAKLNARDLLAQPPFDVSPALARYFPDQIVDLSPAAIDRWLEENRSAVLSFLHE